MKTLKIIKTDMIMPLFYSTKLVDKNVYNNIFNHIDANISKQTVPVKQSIYRELLNENTKNS